MNLGQLIGELRLKLELGDEELPAPAPAPAQVEAAPRVHTQPAVRIVDRIRDALRGAARPLVCAEISKATGLAGEKVGPSIASMKDVRRVELDGSSGGRSKYAYTLIGRSACADSTESTPSG